MFALDAIEPAVWNSSDPNIGLGCSVLVLLSESAPVCMLRLLLKLSSLFPIVLVALLVALNLVRNFSNSAADRPFAIACAFNWSMVNSELWIRSFILLISASDNISTLNWLKSFCAKKPCACAVWAIITNNTNSITLRKNGLN